MHFGLLLQRAPVVGTQRHARVSYAIHDAALPRRQSPLSGAWRGRGHEVDYLCEIDEQVTVHFSVGGEKVEGIIV